MASVRKREWTHKGEKKTAWVVNYTDQDGNRRLKTFDLKKDADRYRLKVENEIEAGVHMAPVESGTVAEVAELFLRDCERRQKISDRMCLITIYGYESILRKHIIPAFGRSVVADIEPEAITEWLKTQRKRAQARTVQGHARIMSMLLSFAVRARKAKRNVMIDFKVKPPHSPKKRVTPPSMTDIRHLLSCLDARHDRERRSKFIARRALVPLLLFCGLRKGEACGLKWENVRFAEGKILVRHGFNHKDGLKSTKTEAGLRDAEMPSIVLDALLALHEFQGRPAEGFVFVTESGRPYLPSQMWAELWCPVMKYAGFQSADGKNKFTVHSLRHACVSLLIQQGLSPIHIKGFIGHSDVRTTVDTYGHLFPEDTRVKSAVRDMALLFDATTARQEPASV